jgi:hypothetical protein
MGVNKANPHVFVLPEDDANRQLATGFHLGVRQIRQMQVLPEVGGWLKVLEEFKAVHIGEMNRNSNRFMILLIDFDGQEDRMDRAREVVPTHLTDRVFVLGVWTEPEDLEGDYETIGAALAKDCHEGTSKMWGDPLLKHNEAEVDRLRERVRSILFTALQ